MTSQIDSGIPTVFGQAHIAERHPDQPHRYLQSDRSLLVASSVWIAFYCIAIVGAVIHKAAPVLIASAQ